MKAIINIAENFAPRDKDMLVYNSKNGIWELKTFVALSQDLAKENKELKSKIEKMEIRCAIIDKKISRLADIVKEEIK